jgi:hypothetical protein
MSAVAQALERIEAKLGGPLPAGYRDWSLKNYTNVEALGKEYLWVSDAEWIPSEEIPDYDFDPFRKDILEGLTPFAFTCGGDPWCWNTQIRTGHAEYEVLCCWHDEDLADVYAPSFPGWFYRRCLNYASGEFARNDRDIQEARSCLKLWSTRLAEIGPRDWADHLEALAGVTPFEYKHPKLRASGTRFGFLTDMEVKDWIAQKWGQRYIDGKVAWGHF